MTDEPTIADLQARLEILRTLLFDIALKSINEIDARVATLEQESRRRAGIPDLPGA